MKKKLLYIIITLLFLCCFTACSSNRKSVPEDEAGTAKKLKIVTTIFPEYDWLMNVLGTNPANAEVTLLLNNGVDLHSYQPSTDDILKISTCDLFLYVGGESDKWVKDTLDGAVNKNMTVLDLLDILEGSVKEEELVEGMQEEEAEESDADEPEYDEHVWLSLRNAETIVNAIARALADIDAENADTYRANAASYTEKLHALDDEYKRTVSEAKEKTLLFADRFPFRYLTDDYGISYYAAFAGCSAETEASFETITFLSKKADELSLKNIFIIEGGDKRIAETIISSTASKDQKILSLNSMQSVTSGDIQNGITYLSIMEDNLKVLSEALN